MFGSSLITGVTNKESPKWLKEKILSLGQKPISAIVDITNYCLLYTSPSPRDLSTSRMPSSA